MQENQRHHQQIRSGYTMCFITKILISFLTCNRLISLSIAYLSTTSKQQKVSCSSIIETVEQPSTQFGVNEVAIQRYMHALLVL